MEEVRFKGMDLGSLKMGLVVKFSSISHPIKVAYVVDMG